MDQQFTTFPITEEQKRSAFNLGSDARILGWPRYSCPYGSLSELKAHWLKGWADAHIYWGIDASSPPGTLPEITD